MEKMSKIFLAMSFVLMVSLVYSQNNGVLLNKYNDEKVRIKVENSKLDFLDKTLLGENKTVTFSVLGIKDEEHEASIIAKLLENPQIHSVKFFYGRRCKVVMHPYVVATDLRGVFLIENVDFDIETMWVNDYFIDKELKDIKAKYPNTYSPSPIPATEWVYPASFPKFISTGNAQKDEEDFAAAKQQWVEDHADEYKIMSGCEYLSETNRYIK